MKKDTDKTEKAGMASTLNGVLSHHVEASIVHLVGMLLVVIAVGATQEAALVAMVSAIARLGEHYDLRRKLKRMVG